MLLHLLLNRFVARAPFGTGQSSVISLAWSSYLLTVDFFWLQKVEYTLGEESEAPGQRLLSSEELGRQLEKLLKEGSNQQVIDWVEVRFFCYRESRVKKLFWWDDGGNIQNLWVTCFSFS